MGLGFLLATLFPLVAAAAGVEVAEEIARILGERQLDPLPREEILRQSTGDLDSLLHSKDPYARYLSPTEYAEFLRGDSTQVGIGVQLSENEGHYYLLPIPDGPAWQAGIRLWVELLSVEGRSVRDQSLQWVMEQLRGEANSSVMMVLETAGGQLLARRIERGAFTSPAVSVAEHDDLLVIRIWDFRPRETLVELRSALKRSLEFPKPPLIDLRYAGGGDLYEALDCTGLFLQSATPVAEIEYSSGQRRGFMAPTGQRLVEQPLFLLIGPGTASAAESFALALQYNQAARLVGEPSYGKCRTQTLVPLSDGGAIRFSNGRLWGPEGAPCRSDGLQPDIPVAKVETKTAGEILSEAVSPVTSLQP